MIGCHRPGRCIPLHRQVQDLGWDRPVIRPVVELDSFIPRFQESGEPSLSESIDAAGSFGNSSTEFPKPSLSVSISPIHFAYIKLSKKSSEFVVSLMKKMLDYLDTTIV